MTTWTEEEDRQLTELWSKNKLSAKEIAVILGKASKNAIVGRAHRLDLPYHQKPKGSIMGGRTTRQDALERAMAAEREEYRKEIARLRAIVLREEALKPIPPAKRAFLKPQAGDRLCKCNCYAVPNHSTCYQHAYVA